MGIEYAVHGIHKETRSKSPDPELTWNKAGRWRRISEAPPTYIPKSYSLNAPRTSVTGNWVVDQRDGKRLFVPKGDVVSKADARVFTTQNVRSNHIRFAGEDDFFLNMLGLQ